MKLPPIPPVPLSTPAPKTLAVAVHQLPAVPVHASVKPETANLQTGDQVRLTVAPDQYFPSAPPPFPDLVYQVVGRDRSSVFAAAPPQGVIAIWVGDVKKA
jgi:hypothetical protein